MNQIGSCVAVYSIHYSDNILEVIKQLKAVDYSDNQLTVIGRGCDKRERDSGVFNFFKQFGTEGKQKEFWNNLKYLLVGDDVLDTPELEKIKIAGGLSNSLLLENSDQIIKNNYSELDRLLYFVGIPETSFNYYESMIKKGKLVLIANGNHHQIETAGELLELSNSIDVSIHFANIS
jgi:hypothetical protein